MNLAEKIRQARRNQHQVALETLARLEAVRASNSIRAERETSKLEKEKRRKKG